MTWNLAAGVNVTFTEDDDTLEINATVPVASVNAKTGAVTLTAADVGADPAGTATSAVSSHNADTTSVHGIADTSDLVVSGDLAAVATSGDYDDLTNLPTLGTAAAQNTEAFAPAAHVGTGGSAHANAVASGAAGFMTGTDKAKLDGIEAGADVTDATNVAAAGAQMVYVHDGSAYQLATGRVFVGPEDPEDDGFTLADGDEWIDPT